MTAATMPNLERNVLLECYERMVLIRAFEEALADLFSKNLLGGTSHFCIGQEACAVGVLSAVDATDYVVSNHRGHGHLLARGLDPERVMAELMGRKNGYCGGRGGSQHLCAMDHHFLGTNGITGGGIPIGTGAAYALKYRRESGAVVVFFGDGATNQGTFHESLNMASLWQLPVLYVCENNGYGMSNPVANAMSGGGVTARARAYGMETLSVDGMNFFEVYAAARDLRQQIRDGGGPVLLELLTYRYCGHSKNDPRVYRSRNEEADWKERDCLVFLGAALRERGSTEEELAGIRTRVNEQMAGVIAASLEAPRGDRAHALGGVYA